MFVRINWTVYHFGCHSRNWPASLWSLLDEPRRCDKIIIINRTTHQQGRGVKDIDQTTQTNRRPNEETEHKRNHTISSSTLLYWCVVYARMRTRSRISMCLSKINALPACFTFNKNCNKVKWETVNETEEKRREKAVRMYMCNDDNHTLRINCICGFL